MKFDLLESLKYVSENLDRFSETDKLGVMYMIASFREKFGVLVEELKEKYEPKRWRGLYIPMEDEE